MKNLIRAGFLACLFSLAVMSVEAQVYVRTRPSRPKVEVKRTPAPSKAHVWVDEEWAPQGNTYAWHGGYWAAPPRPGAVYVRGHWTSSKRGHIWIAGYWK